MAGEFTLAELSKVETDTLRKSVMDTLLMEASVLELCPWETIGALATTIVRYQDLPSVGFRKVNEAYTVGTPSLEQSVENISLMGGFLDVDKAIARAKNTIADARAIGQTMMLKAMAYKFNTKFIKGNPATDPEEFKGLTERIEFIRSAAGGSYTSQYIATACAGSAGARPDGILWDETASHQFLNKLDELMYSIKGHNPDFLFMNKKCLLAIRALLRKEKLLDYSKDMFDRKVDMYGTTRLVDIGVEADQSTEIILNTEDPGDAFTTDLGTSIYAVKFGIGEFMWGIQEYPLEVEDKGLLEGAPMYRTEVDWPLGLAVADPYSIARLYDVFPDSTEGS